MKAVIEAFGCAASLVLGCAGAPPAPAQTGATVETAPVLTIPQTPLAASPTAGPVPRVSGEIPLPAREACTLRSDSLGGDPLTLRSPGGDPFATVGSCEDVAIHLPEGPSPEGTVAEIDAQGVVIRGQLAPNVIKLFPKSPTVVSGCVLPLSGTELTWVDGANGSVRTRFRLDPVVHLVGASVERDWNCGELSFEDTDYDAEGFLTKGRPTDNTMVLRGGRVVRLSSRPGGPTIADVDLTGNDDMVVEVVGVSGAFRRVFWKTDTALVFGWVASGDLKQPGDMIGDSFGAGGLGLSGIGEEGSEKHRSCRSDVPLLAFARDTVWAVGSLRANTPVMKAPKPVEVAGGFVHVVFPSSTVEATKGAALLVREGDFAKCN